MPSVFICVTLKERKKKDEHRFGAYINLCNQYAICVNQC